MTSRKIELFLNDDIYYKNNDVISKEEFLKYIPTQLTDKEKERNVW